MVLSGKTGGHRGRGCRPGGRRDPHQVGRLHEEVDEDERHRHTDRELHRGEQPIQAGVGRREAVRRAGEPPGQRVSAIFIN